MSRYVLLRLPRLGLIGKDIAFKGPKYRGAVFACQGIFGDTIDLDMPFLW
jgi:hypothetical protein